MRAWDAVVVVAITLLLVEVALRSGLVVGLHPPDTTPPRLRCGDIDMQVRLPEDVEASALSVPNDFARRPAPLDDGLDVLVIGDSFARGLGVGPEQRTSTRVVRGLAEATGQETRERNLAACSLGFEEQVALARVELAHHPPDVLLWVFVPDDLGDVMPPLWWSHHTKPRSACGRWVTCDVLSRAFRDGGTPGRLSTRNLEMFERTMRDIVARTEAGGGVVVFAVFPIMHALSRYPLADVHTSIAEAAARAGAEVVDLLPSFQGRWSGWLARSYRDPHPNERAHRIAAEALWTPVLEALERAEVPREHVLADPPRIAPPSRLSTVLVALRQQAHRQREEQEGCEGACRIQAWLRAEGIVAEPDVSRRDPSATPE